MSSSRGDNINNPHPMMRGRRLRLKLSTIAVVLTLCLISSLASAHSSQLKGSMQMQKQKRQLQIPGIFDLSVGNNNGGGGGGSSNNDNPPDKELDAVATDAPTASAAEVTTPFPTIHNDGASTTVAPTPNPYAGATYTASEAAREPGPPPENDLPTTMFPTQPIALLDLPSTVDVEKCRKNMIIANADRNNWLNEAEFVEFVKRVVVQSDPMQAVPGPVWGNTLHTMPPGVQVLYSTLGQGGAISIFGHNPEVNPYNKDPTLVQELFLIKVCVNTEVVVHQVLKLFGDKGEDTTQTAYSIPEVEVVLLYSSFQAINKVGLTSANLGPGSGKNRRGLERAYQDLVTQVVGDKVGQELMLASENAASNRRRLTVTVDPKLPEIYRMDDTPCPGADPNDGSVQTEWCQTAYGKFLLYLVGEDDLAVYDEYTAATQQATKDGKMQSVLEQVEPDAEVRVIGAGPTILPPPPTPSPTPLPALTEAPLDGSQPYTVPEPQLTLEKPDEKHENMEMILVLAAILMMMNCCIIGTSVYLCWKNRHNADIDLGIYDDDPSINDAYYDNLRANRKKRMSKVSQSNRSSRSVSSSGSSVAPTMNDIRASQQQNRRPSRDSRSSREQMLRSQGDSNVSNFSSASGSSAAPTREEIEATLQRSSSQPSASSVRSGRSEESSERFEDEDDSEYPVNRGEMA